MSVVHVVEWCLWLFLIDFECLECKWPTSNSLPILSSSCRSWHANSFEKTLWKVKKWDKFIHSIVWVPASSDMIVIRETVEKDSKLSLIFYKLQFVILFGNGGLNWLQWTAVLLFCSTVLLFYKIYKTYTSWREDVEKRRRSERIHNQPRTQSRWNWDPSPILDGGSVDKLYNPSYFAFSCKLLLCVE